MEHRLSGYDDLRKLVLLKYIENECKKQTDGKNVDSLRYEVDRYYDEMNEKEGTDKVAVWVDGERVATYYPRYSEETRDKREMHIGISNRVEMWKWFATVDGEELRSFATAHIEDFIDWIWSETGEIPDGCTLDDIVIPGKKKERIGWGLRIYQDKMREIVKNKLPGAASLLLGDGDDDIPSD